MTDLLPPITGDELIKQLKEKVIHEPLADGFLYKNASLMISSMPGVGKSVLAVQAIYQLSSGIPLFGALHVPKPLRVWYIQMERPAAEALERLQAMTSGTGIQKDNIFIDIELQALNFLNQDHFREIIKRGHTIQPDLIIIDPLYGIASGLSKDEIGSNLAKLFTILKKELNCTLWINHHTVKNLYEVIDGKKVMKDDPFYGAQWLKAHVTASYLATQSDHGITLQVKKDSHSNLIKDINLCFDQDTFLSTMSSDSLTYAERYKLYVNSIFRSSNKFFDFNRACQNLGCTISTLRGLNRTPTFLKCLKLVKRNGQKTLYEVTDYVQ